MESFGQITKNLQHCQPFAGLITDDKTGFLLAYASFSEG